MAFDKYSELDPAKLQRDIEEQHGSAFFDKYAILDDAHRAQQIETTMGIELSNGAMSNPMLLMQEMVIAGQGDSNWVPAGAKIHIDFVNNHAWSEDAGGEVAINTLLGSDPNSDNSWGDTSYDPAFLVADGYWVHGLTGGQTIALAFIGDARARLLNAATLRFQSKVMNLGGGRQCYFSLASTDGNDAVEVDLNLDLSSSDTSGFSWNGSASISIPGIVNYAMGACNACAITVSANRLEYAVNGSTAAATALAGDDRPAGNPFSVAVIDGTSVTAMQSITIYDPLPTTAGLSALSEVT